jgi:hypothetical protein
VPVEPAVPASRDQPTRLGEVPVEPVESAPYEPQPTRVREVPRELAAHLAPDRPPTDRTPDEGEPSAPTKDQATRLRRVSEEPEAKDQATRLRRVAEEPEAKDQATRVGRVAEEPAAEAAEATGGDHPPADPPDWGAEEAPAGRRPWWKRLFGGAG